MIKVPKEELIHINSVGRESESCQSCQEYDNLDFAGSITAKYNSLPEYWYLWLIATVVVVTLIQIAKTRTMNTQIVCRSLLAAYIVFILFETVIGRRSGVGRAMFTPFWSYGIPELRMEIILNYLLFIPLGVLLYLSFGRKLGLKVVLFGFLLSASIELTQLIFKIGLFEFDDMIGNTIGTLIGAVIGKLVVMMVKKRKQKQ